MYRVLDTIKNFLNMVCVVFCWLFDELVTFLEVDNLLRLSSEFETGPENTRHMQKCSNNSKPRRENT